MGRAREKKKVHLLVPAHGIGMVWLDVAVHPCGHAGGVTIVTGRVEQGKDLPVIAVDMLAL